MTGSWLHWAGGTYFIGLYQKPRDWPADGRRGAAARAAEVGLPDSRLLGAGARPDPGGHLYPVYLPTLGGGDSTSPASPAPCGKTRVALLYHSGVTDTHPTLPLVSVAL
ncbi:MAG: hypothetical protein ACLSHC_10905 [Bilophila wadsworthia]